MPFVDLETARHARGLRLVVLASVPSPWSQAARAIVEYKRIEALLVRLQPDGDAVRAWTGVHNAPVALYDDEPPRSGWAEILALTERLRPGPALIPAQVSERAMMHGLSHELMGEGGLLWCMRLLAIDASLVSAGQEAWPLPVAKRLGARYGYAPGCSSAARERMVQVLAALDAQWQRSVAAGHGYLLGAQPCALDFYWMAVADALAPLSHEQCAMHPIVRKAFEWTHAQIAERLPLALIAHRDTMHARHAPLPVEL